MEYFEPQNLERLLRYFLIGRFILKINLVKFNFAKLKATVEIQVDQHCDWAYLVLLSHQRLHRVLESIRHSQPQVLDVRS